ncbi:MAG: glycogen debranching protein GlgX [Gemmatimonadales bacterium]
MIDALPGNASPLGAAWDGEGTNFALASAHATAVDLCLFAAPDNSAASERIGLCSGQDGVWHTYLPGIGPGQLYGYRVHGPYAPEQGHRFNPARLLLDPYARAVSGAGRWEHLPGSAEVTDPRVQPSPDPRDTAGMMPKSIVVDPAFEWEGDRPPRTPWERTLIYECHVKGMTMLHPGVPEELRGTYLGLASEPIIDHFLRLGVTAVELLPVHHSVTEPRLAALGLVNYWGYSPIGYFAPDPRFAREALGGQVAEFKMMVARLHRAGLEVILDVVYNHTAEGDHRGPTLCFRGVDNAAYYRLDPDDPSRYVDYTGCGNTLDIRRPRTLELVLDSLRYWVAEMHVDGFRFDIAPVLARADTMLDPAAPFFEAVRRDPVLSGAKLIAEPWDLGPDGYQVGRFPAGWAEWNGKYRDGVRRFWRGDPGSAGEMASRLTGSSDLYEPGGRGPLASVNFVTCHDGFTLHDLVSYETKHNEANGEGNRDGADHNLSRNWGVEGPAEATQTIRRRERVKRDFLATLAFSLGVPMISHGDELGRTQRGNNNAYCHDSPLTWLDWRLTPAQEHLLEFTRTVFALRRRLPELNRSGFFPHDQTASWENKQLAWLRVDGTEMTADDWHDPARHVLGMLIRNEAHDPVLLLWLNGGSRSAGCTVPAPARPGSWSSVLDTEQDPPRGAQLSGECVRVAPHALVLLLWEASP